jgi:transposase
MDGEGTS